MQISIKSCRLFSSNRAHFSSPKQPKLITYKSCVTNIQQKEFCREPMADAQFYNGTVEFLHQRKSKLCIYNTLCKLIKKCYIFSIKALNFVCGVVFSKHDFCTKQDFLLGHELDNRICYLKIRCVQFAAGVQQKKKTAPI